MLIGFYKGQPTDYVMIYVGGKVKRSGTGLATLYLPHNTVIVAVPTVSRDTSFVFNEVTKNFQAVTIQGQYTYRIANPELAANLLNFTVDTKLGRYKTDDPEHIAQRITNIIQRETRAEIQQRTLEQSLNDTDAIASVVFERARSGKQLEAIGVELLSVYFLAMKPTPEVAKALEAEHRETLLRHADEAIYARRAAAVQEERKIKENELNNDIALEDQRRQLIDLQGTNALQEAEYRGRALLQDGTYRAQAIQLELDAYQGRDSKQVLALAMRDIGAKADKLGNLTITTEMLSGLLNG